MRRSSADGRDAYYSLDLAACRSRMTEAGGALHAGLRLVPAQWSAPPSGHRVAPAMRVLFLCTGNSARSQVAEAMLQRRGGTAVDVVSAGSHPKPVHLNAVRVMRERGIDIRDRRSKHVRVFAGRRFDRVISLCDRVREVCPDFPGTPEVAHWSIADPAAEGTDDEQSYPAFVRMADELSTRDRVPAVDDPTRTRQQGRTPDVSDDPADLVNVRYMVDDVEASIDFYTRHLGFSVRTSFAPAFADVTRGNLRLLLSGPTSSAGRPMPDGRQPGTGGMEPHPSARRGHRCGGGAAARCGAHLPERHRHRTRRPADPARRSIGQRGRAASSPPAGDALGVMSRDVVS